MSNSYYAAILTLYDSDRRIDRDSQREYIRFLLRNKVKGFFPCGTSGEYTGLTRQENLDILRIVTEENKQNLPVIPCASTASVFLTLELMEEMEKMGIEEVSICPPYYTPLRQSDILDYYLTVLKESRMNVYLYNIPAFTNPIAPETFERLMENPRILGIKDSSGSMKTISRYMAAVNGVREGFRVMTGTDEMILPALCAGCYGSVSALSGIIPEAHNLLYDTYSTDLEQARRLQTKITRLAAECEDLVFPVGYKLALEARGFPMPAFRQNVAEQKNEVCYEQKRDKIHRLVQELTEWTEKETLRQCVREVG